jgi:hypothetical protein
MSARWYARHSNLWEVLAVLLVILFVLAAL